MKLTEYTELAVRTESQPDELLVNHQLLVNVLYMYTAAGRMLDQLKKHMFYRKDYSVEKFNSDYNQISSALYDILTSRVNGTPEEMGEEPIENINTRILHATIGIATESTEMCETLYKALIGDIDLDNTLGGNMDLVNMREENGDINWYQAIFYDAMREMGYVNTWEDDLKTNIAKLKARYPNKFTEEDAISRNLKIENEILTRGHK